MLFRDYIEQVEQAAREWMEDNRGYFDPSDDMRDILWAEDSVTGNGSGSYTFSTYAAWENITGAGLNDCLLFDDEFIEEAEGLGLSLGNLMEEGPEAIDVTARCLALGFVDFEEIVDELFGDEEEEEEEEEEDEEEEEEA